MNTIGFPISHKENEKRRTILPEHISLLSCPQNLYFEKGYGDVLGIKDDEFRRIGAHIVSREETLQQDVICDPKVGDAEYLTCLQPGQIIFGWIHATQNRDITDKITSAKLTAYAWEKMYRNGRHLFWRNNELAGEAAIIHAFQCWGQLPYEAKVAVIGRGNTARGAIKILNIFGTDIVEYDRKTADKLREDIGDYDVIVNCVLWDVFRKDHLIYKSDLKNMKRGSMIVDVSCDKNGGVESSLPTTISNPTYITEGILHYVVDHTPALFYKTFSYNNSQIIYPYIEELLLNQPTQTLIDSLIIKNGAIIDPEIIRYQKR